MSEAKACILSVSGQKLTSGERALLSDAKPWGVILMGRSCGSPEQVRGLVDEMWGAIGRPVLVFIDQEGGRVARLKPPNWPTFPPAARYGEIYRRNRELGIEASWLGHRLLAAELEALGIHADCAPDVDLLHAGAHSVIGDRSFGAETEMVGVLAKAALEGLAAGGVAGVIKHMPGHGRAEVDSHEAMPVVRASREELARDIEAFRFVSDAAMGMTAHLAFTEIDGETPATLSSKIITDVIRGEIGFDGLLMTDDIGMNALGGSLAERTKRAMDAGCDVVLHCSGFVKEPEEILREMTEVAEAAPELSGKSMARAQAAERASLQLAPFDRADGWVRFEELLAGGGQPVA